MHLLEKLLMTRIGIDPRMAQTNKKKAVSELDNTLTALFLCKQPHCDCAQEVLKAYDKRCWKPMTKGYESL